MKERDTKDLIVLLMIPNKEINQVLENQLQAIDAQIRIQNYLRSADQFLQITFELHHLTDITHKEQIINCLNKLNMTHQAVWIHANNFGHIERAKGYLQIKTFGG